MTELSLLNNLSKGVSHFSTNANTIQFYLPCRKPFGFGNFVAYIEYLLIQ